MPYKPKLIRLNKIYDKIDYKHGGIRKRLVEINGKKYLKYYSPIKEKEYLIHIKGKNKLYISKNAYLWILKDINEFKQKYISLEKAAKLLNLSIPGIRHFIKKDKNKLYLIRHFGDEEYLIEIKKYKNKIYLNKQQLKEYLEITKGISLWEVENKLGLNKKTLTKIFSKNKGKIEFNLNGKKYIIKLKKVSSTNAKISYNDLPVLEKYLNIKKKIKNYEYNLIISQIQGKYNLRKQKIEIIKENLKYIPELDIYKLKLLKNYDNPLNLFFIEFNQKLYLKGSYNLFFILNFWLDTKLNNIQKVVDFLEIIKNKKTLNKTEQIKLWLCRDYYNTINNIEIELKLDEYMGNKNIVYLYEKYPLEKVAKQFSEQTT